MFVRLGCPSVPATPHHPPGRMHPAWLLALAEQASAVHWMQVAIQQAATDPVTGAIDMDLIQTGVSASERIARGQLAQEIKKLLISPPLSSLTLAPSSACSTALLPCTLLMHMYATASYSRWCQAPRMPSRMWQFSKT